MVVGQGFPFLGKNFIRGNLQIAYPIIRMGKEQAFAELALGQPLELYEYEQDSAKRPDEEGNGWCEPTAKCFVGKLSGKDKATKPEDSEHPARHNRLQANQQKTE